jgi:hypothetical protein
MIRNPSLALALVTILLPQVAGAEQYAVYCTTKHKIYISQGQANQIDPSEKEDTFNVKIRTNELRSFMTLLSVNPIQLYCNKHEEMTVCVDSLYQSYHWTFKGDDSFVQTFTEAAGETPFVLVREGSCKRI